MRRFYASVAAFLLAFAAGGAEEELLRNPFWPQGYEGRRYAITLEPRVKPKPPEAPPLRGPGAQRKAAAKVPTAAETAAAARRKAEAAARKAAEAAQQAEDKLWNDARKKLVFGPACRYSSAKEASVAVAINGKSYGVGDLVSTTVGDNRFTWTIESISSEGKLKLKRVKRRSIGKTKKQ